MELKIDYNRGVMKKVDVKTGIEVYMYLDLPGIYYNAFETEISEDLAASAGFDIAKYGKMKKRREQLAVAMEAIDKALDNPDYSEPEEVVLERGGFKVVHIGLGRHIINDPDGGNFVGHHLTLEEAKAALEKLVPEEPLPAKEKKVAVKNLAAAK